VRAGLARARADGKTLGRPRIAEKTERAVRSALSKKDRPGLRKIAASFGVGVGTVRRINRELNWKVLYVRTAQAMLVYVLGSRRKNDRRTYVGWTTDLKRRLRQHNAGRGAKSTRGRNWTLLYSECCKSRSEAMSREWYIKHDRKFRSTLWESIR
jgi:putative endonuclease